MSVTTIVALLTAAVSGGVVQALITWIKDRRKDASDVHKTDVDTKLAYLNTVIEHLDKQAERERSEKERAFAELAIEQKKSSDLRKEVYDLKEELYAVRMSARETEHRCDELAARLQRLIQNTRDDAA